MKNLIIAMAGILLVLGACRKDHGIAETYSGKCNCIINGKNWEAMIADTAKPAALYDRFLFFLYVKGNDSTSIDLRLRNSGILTTGKTYDLNTGYTGWTQYREDSCFYWTLTDLSNPATITFSKIDTINHIVTGSFKHLIKRFDSSATCNDMVDLECNFDVRASFN